MIIGKRFKIDAAHYLPEYLGKCREMHGHTWYITVEVEGKIRAGGPTDGMVIDLNELSTAVHCILDRWDHRLLNEFFPEAEAPTCERLTQEIALRLQEYLPSEIFVHEVRVQEGEGGYARWIRG